MNKSKNLSLFLIFVYIAGVMALFFLAPSDPWLTVVVLIVVLIAVMVTIHIDS